MYQRRAIAAGLAIGLAGLLNLYLGGGLLGALAFGLGLLVVCALKLDLFTGKMRQLYNKKINWKELIIIFLGNAMGVFIMYCLGTALMSYPEIDEQAVKIMTARGAYPFGFIFVRAIICGICVQMAVDMWNLNATRGGLPVGVHPFLAMLPASAFVLLGCNHCIADLLYLFYSDMYNHSYEIFEALAGNMLGGIIFVGATTDMHNLGSPLRKRLGRRFQKNNNTSDNDVELKQDSSPVAE